MLRLAITALLIAAAAAAGAETSGAAGQDLFTACTSCHGSRGEGNREIHAPKIAGLQGWYVERQLSHFRNGIRGASEEDVYGSQMARMAETLWDQRDVRTVAAYVEQLPPIAPERTVKGNAARGSEQLATTCSECHGARGEGIEALGAPRLAGLDDWYVVAQLAAFRRGLRGAHVEDTYGRQMRERVATLTDEQAALDLAAYLSTLSTNDGSAAESPRASDARRGKHERR